ncbi:hypothetical protein [Candidatus Laterigemmans baculatus]|uniref:hypothetical protein n=1 Tax=Candidatus Laterigemmans baculatus TaxID=2770505 RepID=UPI0013D976F3|nr:hypothetical protein [Candidatus Laterigemmans baculatus]
MQRVSSYRSGIDAGDRRPRSPRALRGAAVLGMLASISLGCTSPGPTRGNLAGGSPLNWSGVEGASGGEAGEDPQLAAAFARLAEARAEHAAEHAAEHGAGLASRPSPRATGAGAEVARAPASELLPGSRPASIPVWPGVR